MKKTSIILAVIIGFFAILLVYSIHKRVDTPMPVTVVSAPETTSEPAPKVTLTVAHLYEMIEPCEKLVTVSDQYVNTATLTKSAKIWGKKVPFTTDQKSFTYIGTIQVGIDLSEIQFDVNEASQTIYVTLPAPEIISHSIDTSSFVFTTEKDGLFTDILPEDFVSEANSLKAQQEDKLILDGKAFRQAKRNSETTITKLIKAAPEASDYKLNFYYT